MTKNTNNSLSDINNEGGLGFNRLLSDNEITNSESNNDKIFKLENENIALRTKLLGADPMNANQINSTIELNNKEIERITSKNTKTDTFTKDGYPTSLFDRNAYIDYGRGIRNPKWEEYKKDKKGDENGSFITNNTKSINEPVEYNDNSLTMGEGLSLQNLIKWSEKYPALQLRGQDFSYCKLLGYYPNNRLVILRRFKGGVPDNLFDYFETGSKIEFTQPLATMVTWLKPDDDIITMNFNETWIEHNKSIIETIKGYFKEKGEKDEKSDMFSDILTSTALNNIINEKEDGTDFGLSAVGKPNLITSAKKRQTKGAETSKDNLVSTIAFTLTFEYELRYIEKIDPSIAMLDLISNAMRMGTSESEFMYNIPALKDSKFINSFINGDISTATDVFVKNITEFTKELGKTISDTLKGAVEELDKIIKNPAKALGNIASDSAKFIISRYREDLRGAISADTGLPSGVWHVTIGNPKAPIVSCGDLIISSSELTLGKELGYNDFPNSFSVKYILGLARSRGRQELAKILNSGRGRLYVYPKAKDNPDFNIY